MTSEQAESQLNHDSLWKLMTKVGCLDMFRGMVRLLHEDMQAKVLNDNDASAASYTVSNASRLGATLLSTMFMVQCLHGG